MADPAASAWATRNLTAEHFEYLERLFTHAAGDDTELSFLKFRTLMVECCALSFSTRPIVSVDEALARFRQDADPDENGVRALLKGLPSTDPILNKMFKFADIEDRGSLEMAQLLTFFGGTARADEATLRTFLFSVTDLDGCGAINCDTLARFYAHASKLLYNICMNSVGAERRALAEELQRGIGDLDTVSQLDSLLDECEVILSSVRQCSATAASNFFNSLQMPPDSFITQELWEATDILELSPMHSMLATVLKGALDYSAHTQFLVPALRLPRLPRAAPAPPASSPAPEPAAPAPATPPAAAAAAPPAATPEAAEALKQLGSLNMLRDAGVLSPEEFEERRLQVVDRLTSTTISSPPVVEPVPTPEPEALASPVARPAPAVRTLDVGLSMELFEEFDTNGDGHLDESEVVQMMMALHTRQGKPWMTKYHDSVCIQVRADLRKYDLDGNGTLEFPEFLNMLCHKPWSALLEERAPTPLDRVGLLFSQADTDSDGFLDRSELEQVVCALCSQLDKHWLLEGHQGSLVEQVERAMLKFDTNGDGKLSLDEFVTMLHHAPWAELFGVGGTTAASPMRVERRLDGSTTASRSPLKADTDLAGTSRAASLRGAAFGAAAAASNRAAELAFRMVDTDGNGFIDEDELLAAARELRKHLQEVPQGFEEEQLATQAFALFDLDHDGLIDLAEWKEMLSVEPWCQLLPDGAREATAALRHGEWVKDGPGSPNARVMNRIRVAAEMGAVARSAPIPEEEEPGPFVAPEVVVPEPEPLVAVVELVAADGGKLAVVVCSPEEAPESATAGAIVFPAQEECLDGSGGFAGSWELWCEWYTSRGMYAVCVQSSRESELGHYFDAQAAVEYCMSELALPANGLLCHGLGFGAALASAAAVANPGIGLTVEQAFASAEEFADGAQTWDSAAEVMKLPVPAWVARSLGIQTSAGSAAAVLTKGARDTRLPGYETDLYDNERKARRLQGSYVVMHALMDAVMRPDFPIRLFDACYARQQCDLEQMREQRLIQMNGGHGSFFGEDSEASHKYERYLVQCGMLPDLVKPWLEA